MFTAFKQYLLTLKLSPVSRKLYLSDIRRFLSTLGGEPTLDQVASAASYIKYLDSLRAQAMAPSMLKRTIASLRQFASFLTLTYSVPNPVLPLAVSRKPHANDYIKHFTNYLNGEHLSPLTIKSYKSDLTRYLNWANTHLAGSDISELLRDKNIQKYLNHLTDSGSTLPSTIDRKEKSITRFGTWFTNAYAQPVISDNNADLSHTRYEGLPHTGYVIPNNNQMTTPDVIQIPVKNTNSRIPWIQSTIYDLRSTISFVILLIFVATLAIFGYRQFSKDASLIAAFPSTPVTPNRQLSFQGRLENAAGTPIAVATDLTFKLFNALTGPTELYSTGTCSITPDSDGVFSTQIGSSCGAAIPSSVFTENSNIFLEVVVDVETLAPRQPIASVAYALNSETIQGFPISATVSAVRNTVVPMNQWGEIIIGEQSPRMTGVSGTFAISAPSISITTTTGSNGNITFAPDGTGQVNINGNTTSTNFFNVSDAQLTTGSLITGTAGNDNTGFKLIDLLSGSSPTSKFSVTDAGLTTVGDDLKLIGGDILDSNGNENIRFGTTASAVNEATLTNSATGGTVLFAATGGDTDIALSIDSKGADALNLNGTATGDINLAGGSGSTGCTITNSTGAISCTAGITASSVPFSGITSATNTSAAMIVGAGASLDYTSTGTINASSLLGGTWDIPGTIGSTTPNTGAFTTLTTTSTASISGTLTVGNGTTNTIQPAYGPLSLAYKSGLNAWTTGLTLKDTTGNVGIGTTTPNYLLNVVGGSTGVNSSLLTLRSNFSANNTGASIRFANSTSSTTDSGAAEIGATRDAGGNTSLTFKTYNGSLGEKARIDSAGNLGIGTTGPDARLDSLATTEQLRLTYTDGTVYSAHTVDLSGNLTIDNTGTKTIIADDLQISGDDLIMGTNTAGMLLIADGTNFNPTAVSGDITIDSTGLTAIGADKITEAMLKSVNAGTDEMCLTYEATVGDFEWQTCGSGGGDSNWRLTVVDGTLSPVNDTLDVLIGGIATASAKIGLININSGTPTINLANQASNIAIADNAASSFKIVEGANTYLNITTTDNAESFSLNLPAGGVTSHTGNLFTSNIAQTVNIGTGTAVDTINIGTGGTGADLITLGSITAGNVSILSGAALALSGGTGSLINFPSFDVTTAGAITTIDGVTHTIDDVGGNLTLTSNGTSVDIINDLAVNGATSADITSTTTTASIFNSTVTTLSLGGGTTALNIGPSGSGASTTALSGGSADTGCTIDGATGDLTCSGIITGSAATTKWNGITNPDGDLTLAMTGFKTAFNWINNVQNQNNISYSLSNTGGTAGTDNLFVLSSAVSTNIAGDLNTEALLLLDQADTTAAGNTALDNAILITNSGGSTLTDGIHIGSTTQAITNGINMGGSTGIGTDLILHNGDIINNGAAGTITITPGSGTTETLAVATATTLNLFNTQATTVSMGGSAITALNLGNGTGNYTAINLGSGIGTHVINIAGTGATAADTINIGTGASATDTINIGSGAVATALNLTSGTGPQTHTSSNASGVTTTSSFVFSDTVLTVGTGLYVNTTSTPIANTATTQNLFNTTYAQGTSANTNGFVGLGLKFTQAPTVAGNTEYAMQIQNQAKATASTDTTVAALLRLDNADTATGSLIAVTDGLLITNSGGEAAGIINGITLGSTTITNDLKLHNSDLISNTASGTITITPGSGTTETLDVATATTLNLFNTQATTISLGGAATTLNLAPTGSGVSSIIISGGSADTGCTIDGATGNLTCSGIIAGSAATSKWNGITTPDGNLTLAMGAFTTDFNWINNVQDQNNISYSLSNTGGTAGTDNLFVLSSAVSTNVAGDLNTEALLLLDQADTTAAGNTILDNAIKITNSGGSTLTNGITIGSTTQAITNGINMGGSTGITTDIVLQNSETIDNNVDGTLNIGTTIMSLTGGTSMVTDQTSFNLFNTTTTTLNIGGAATGNLNIGGGAVTHVINLAGTGATLADTINIGTGGTTADTITIGSTLASTSLVLNDDNWNVTAAGLANFVSIGAATPGTGVFTTLSSTGNTTIGDASGDTLTANADVWTFVNDTNFVLSGGVNGLSFDTDTLSIDATSNSVGIGNVAPVGKLDVSGAVTGKALVIFNETGDQNILTASASGITKFNVGRDGTVTADIYADIVAPTTYYLNANATGTSLAIAGDILNTETAPFSITSSGNSNIILDAGSGNVILGGASAGTILIKSDGSGKLDAGTIDPPYTINGGKFATYMASMTGVKEETTGLVTTTDYVQGQGYRSTLDFAGSPEGSDIWLFSKTTDLKNHLDQLVVLLSSNSNTRTWYELEPITGKLYLYSNIPSNISYRLTAPRFDSASWSNIRDRDSASSGFILNDNGPWSVTGSLATTINNDMLVAAQDDFEAQRAAIQELKTNLISPIAEGEPIKVSGPVVIHSLQGTEPCQELQGSVPCNSTPLLIVEGEIAAATISARVAKLQDIQAETITAKNIVADTISANHIEGLDAKIASMSGNLSDTEITTITDRIKARLDALTGNLPTASDIPTPPEATSSATTGVWNLDSNVSTASDSAMINTLDANIVTINNYLAVIGSATITTLDITNGFYTNTISSKDNLLAIQPMGGIINLANNTLVVDSAGQVALNGDLMVSGTITASALNLERLNVLNEAGVTVATIDASGSANLASLTTNMITIASSSQASNSATPSGLLTSMTSSNATAGESILVSPGTELTIESPYVTGNSLVYLTPTGNTDNKVLFVKSKQTCPPLESGVYSLESCTPSFTVAIDLPASTDISFNWWIIQLK